MVLCWRFITLYWVEIYHSLLSGRLQYYFTFWINYFLLNLICSMWHFFCLFFLSVMSCCSPLLARAPNTVGWFSWDLGKLSSWKVDYPEASSELSKQSPITRKRDKNLFVSGKQKLQLYFLSVRHFNKMS